LIDYRDEITRTTDDDGIEQLALTMIASLVAFAGSKTRRKETKGQMGKETIVGSKARREKPRKDDLNYYPRSILYARLDCIQDSNGVFLLNLL
jgi:hypothetical protein